MDILTVMALDNETEDVLDYLVQHCPESKAKILVDVGMHHLLPNARWQLAEFLYRRRVDDFTTFLQRLSQDEDAYVRKRANNCLTYLQKKE